MPGPLEPRLSLEIGGRRFVVHGVLVDRRVTTIAGILESLPALYLELVRSLERLQDRQDRP